MRQSFFFILVLSFVHVSLLAQTEQLIDSVLLNEVKTYAPYKKYQAGAKVESITSDQLELAESNALDNLLMRYTPIYLKSNAGGLSTIRFRGTAANHTSVNFGGININSLTLGHSNFSNVPVYLFDGIDLQYGSSSTVNGSGSIGGAIHLVLKNNWVDGSRIKATISEGSFGEQLYGTKIFAGNGKFESVSRLYYSMLKNNFPFFNPDNNKEYKQRGAMVENMGLIQELNYKFNEKEWIKNSIWLEHDWHQIQLLMKEVVTDNTVAETLDDKHVRLWSEYENLNHAIKFKSGLGFVHDMQIHADVDEQKIGTNRVITEIEAQQDFNTKIGYKIGGKYIFVKPKVYAYDENVIDHEQQADLYVSAFYMPLPELKMTINLRQQYVTDFEAPFTPSFGTEYRIFTNEECLIKLTANIGRSYRVPTFNDRFWNIGGNPDLKPEDGMNYEIGINYKYKSAVIESDLKLNAFYMDIKNWIEWSPVSIVWEPFNKSRVVSKGVEISLKNMISLDNVNINYCINYSYNPTEIKDDSIDDLIGRPIIYVPKHMGNTSLDIKYRLWRLFIDGSYTGKRLANYSGNIFNPDYEELDGYFLLNSSLSRKIKINKHNFSVILSSQNLMDKQYVNEPGYAMWGRSFRFTLSTDLTFNKN